MRVLTLVGLIASMSMASQSLVAQPPPGGGRMGRGRGTPEERAQLEQRFKERLAAVVQQRLGLTDEQTRRLSDVNQKYEVKRMDLVKRERETRIALRKELDEPSSANSEHVEQLLREMTRFQHERLDLIDGEQADLAKFLTPVQRAQYLGLQEQMRRRIEAMRDRPEFMSDSAGPRGRMGMQGPRPRRPPTP